MLDKARIGLRYGIESALKLEYFVDNLLKSFTGIYQKIESGSKVYNTVIKGVTMDSDWSGFRGNGPIRDQHIYL